MDHVDGRLAVQHEGRVVASQEAPPRSSILRSFDTRTVHTTVPKPPHQRCHQEVGGRSGVNGHNPRSGQTPRRC